MISAIKYSIKHSLKFRVILFSIIAFPFAIISQGAESQQSDQADLVPVERWFEIEIILYKSNNVNLQEGESWDTDTKLKLPEKLVDFLQPYGFPEVESSEIELNNLQNGESDSIESPTEESSLAHDETKQNVASVNGVLETPRDTINELVPLIAGSQEDENLNAENIEIAPIFEAEKPFIPLDASLLRLAKEAKSIDSNANYQLLGHFAWRQAVSDKGSAQSVRIAAGTDFKDTFEYSGEKIILSPSPVDDSDEEILLSELIEDSVVNNKLLLDDAIIQEKLIDENNKDLILTPNETKHKESLNESFNQSPDELSNSTEEAQPVALPWVPEVDGSLIVFIHRNYLHINTNIFYRVPGKEEIDLYSLGSSFASLESDLDNQPVSFAEPIINTLADNSLTDTSLTDSGSFEDSSKYDDNRLVWHYQDDFLLDEPEKNYTERLFNYPLKQNRRLRSTELHYFDHPLIGMLVMITPYEINPEEPSSELDTLQP